MKEGDASDFKNQHLPATSNLSQENVIHTASDKDEKQCVESEGIVKRKCNRGGGWAWEQSFCWRWWGCGLCFWGHCWWDMPARWWRSWAMRSTESWGAGLPLLSLLIFPTHTLSSIKKKKKNLVWVLGKCCRGRRWRTRDAILLIFFLMFGTRRTWVFNGSRKINCIFHVICCFSYLTQQRLKAAIWFLMNNKSSDISLINFHDLVLIFNWVWIYVTNSPIFFLIMGNSWMSFPTH